VSAYFLKTNDGNNASINALLDGKHKAFSYPHTDKNQLEPTDLI